MRDSKRDTDVKNRLLDSEKVRVGWFERIALKYVYYHTWNRSSVQDQCMRQGAQGWRTGMTLRDGIRREVRGRLWMGDTCPPMADSCECMAKTTHTKKTNWKSRPLVGQFSHAIFAWPGGLYHSSKYYTFSSSLSFSLSSLHIMSKKINTTFI